MTILPGLRSSNPIIEKIVELSRLGRLDEIDDWVPDNWDGCSYEIIKMVMDIEHRSGLSPHFPTNRDMTKAYVERLNGHVFLFESEKSLCGIGHRDVRWSFSFRKPINSHCGPCHRSPKLKYILGEVQPTRKIKRLNKRLLETFGVESAECSRGRPGFKRVKAGRKLKWDSVRIGRVLWDTRQKRPM